MRLPLNVSFDYYRIFYASAMAGSFTGAAETLHTAQPNVTRAIKKLEEALNCQLFIRTSHGTKLTTAGERLFEHVRLAMEQIGAGEEQLLSEQELKSGMVEIGASEIGLNCFLLPILKEYHERYPMIRIRISNYSTPQAIQALKHGLVDIAVVTGPVERCDGLLARELYPIHEIAVCGQEMRELSVRKRKLEELIEYPLIALGSNTQTYSLYKKLFQELGMPYEPDVEVATADQILPFVRNNLGIGFIVEEFLELQADKSGVYPIKLTEELPRRSITYFKSERVPLSTAARELERMILKL